MTMIHGLLPEDRSDDLDAVVRAGALAAVLRALADPTRLASLAHLEGGEHSLTLLRAHLGLAQSTVWSPPTATGGPRSATWPAPTRPGPCWTPPGCCWRP